MSRAETLDRVIAAEDTSEAPTCLAAMDRQADRVIEAWRQGGLAASLLPPPFEMTALTAEVVRMGQRLALIYEVEITAKQLKPLAKAIVGGITGVAPAACIDTDVFNYLPGIHTWVMPLIQPPIAAEIAYSAGSSLKAYHGVLKAEGRALSPEELQKLVTEALRKRIG